MTSRVLSRFFSSSQPLHGLFNTSLPSAVRMAEFVLQDGSRLLVPHQRTEAPPILKRIERPELSSNGQERRKEVSPAELEEMRVLRSKDSKNYSAAVLAEKFNVKKSYVMSMVKPSVEFRAALRRKAEDKEKKKPAGRLNRHGKPFQLVDRQRNELNAAPKVIVAGSTGVRSTVLHDRRPTDLFVNLLKRKVRLGQDLVGTRLMAKPPKVKKPKRPRIDSKRIAKNRK